jgi:hypothetical protein
MWQSVGAETGVRVNQLSAISSRARGPRRIRPELWVEPSPISFCQILFDRIGRAGGAAANQFVKKKNRRRPDPQLGQDSPRRSAPRRQGIKSTIPPA